ncbi:alkaline phosphatase family protein [candidate division CSSED10-310 bacterium]|uniref:Alkaline phosphatase family protein n=1 Tax=candidate division CSSED10-310 bacterium TaxID=2855610 RepID=A0ABV6Z467_UNCC1
MVHQEAPPTDRFLVPVLIPAWLTGLLISVQLFRVNSEQLLVFQVYFITFSLLVFYLVGALVIQALFLSGFYLLSRITPREFLVNRIIRHHFQWGIIPGIFGLFFVADIFRHSFFITGYLPKEIIWIGAAVFILLFIFSSISILYNHLARYLTRLSKRKLAIILFFVTLIYPYLEHRYLVELPVAHLKNRLLARAKNQVSELESPLLKTEERMLLFGVDGATWHFLIPFMKIGRCPSMSRLFKTGVSGELSSILPTLSPVIWTSIATGMLPEKHGILHFSRLHIPLIGTLPAKLRWPEHTLLPQLVRLLRKNNIITAELYTSQMRKVPTFYEILSHWGDRVGVVNWWCSWPVTPQNGFIISDRFGYSIGEAILEDEVARSAEIFPPFLDRVYRPLIRKPDEIELNDITPFMAVDEQDLQKFKNNEKNTWLFSNWFWFRTVHQSDRSMADIGFELYKKYNPRLFCLYQQSIDVVEHHYWHYLEPQDFPSLPAEEIDQFRRVIPETYDYEDRILSSFLENGELNTVILVSDHGMLPTKRLPKSGDHVAGCPAGIFLAHGKPFKSGYTINGISIIDVTPLILVIMGYPVGRDMDGRIPTEALTDDFLAQYVPQAITSYGQISQTLTSPLTSPTDQELYHKLKGLGYMN